MLAVLAFLLATHAAPLSVSQSPCLAAKAAALQTLSWAGPFVPQCDDNGAYAPMQCWPQANICWCVDSYGQEVPNTRNFLPAAILSSCPSLPAARAAEPTSTSKAATTCNIDPALISMVKQDRPGGPRFAALSSSTVLFTARNKLSSGGTRQVFISEIRAGQASVPKQVTQDPQTVSGFVPRPNVPSQIVYMTDKDGDEHIQFTLLDMSSGANWRITNDPSKYHVFGAFARSGNAFTYTVLNDDVTPPTTTVMLYDFIKNASRIIAEYSDPVGVSAGPLSIDERFTVVSIRSPSIPSDNDLYLIDILGIAGPVLLTQHNGNVNPVQWDTASFRFHPTNPYLAYVLSDESDRDALWIIRLDTLERRRILGYANQDISRVSFSKDFSVAAVTATSRDFGSYHFFKISQDGLDWSEVSSPIAPSPLLIGHPVLLSEDGSAMLHVRETLREGPQVQVLNFANQVLVSVTPPLAMPAVLQPLADAVVDDYASHDGVMIPAFDFPPQAGVASGKVPYMILVHGGPKGMSGPKLDAKTTSIPLHFIRTKGVGVFVPNVRGSTGFGKKFSMLDNRDKRFDAVKDVVAAVDHLCSRPDVDCARIGIIGGSYGGWMTLQVSTVASSRLGVAIDLFGISDFGTFLKNTAPHRRRDRALEYGDAPGLVEALSPARHACDIQTPLMVIQGSNDIRVPLSESQQMVEKVRSCGGTVEGVFIGGEGHGFVKDKSKEDVVTAIVRFLASSMLGKELAGVCSV